MNKPIICFAHANGFPSKTYRKFFSFLTMEYKIVAIENIGHQLEYPVDGNWRYLSLELEHYLEKNFTQPVIGVGHSLGGALHLITALKRPELYSQLIILDAPLYGPIKSILLKIFKYCNLMGRITPSVSSAKRRNFWPSRQAALDYLKNKSLYKNFDKDCLEDYIEFGMKEVPNGVQLVVEPKIEGKIFENLPDNLAWKTSSVPTTFVHAIQSHVISKLDLHYLQHKFEVININGSHLFPFEIPELAAECVRNAIQAETKVV